MTNRKARDDAAVFAIHRADVCFAPTARPDPGSTHVLGAIRPHRQ